MNPTHGWPKSRYRAGALILLAGLILANAFYIRTWNIQAESLDGDELFSRRLALASPHKALSLIREDLMHPPLYYFALKAMLPMTGSDANGIRTLSLLCGVGSIPVILCWGLVAPGLKRPSWLAAGLITVNSLAIFYSQQARSYSLYSLCISVLILWALALERFGSRFWFWACGTALMVLTLYTHYVGALFIGSVCLATICTRGLAARVKLCMSACTLLAAACFLPWLAPEIAVYKAKHGLAGNIAWQGIPTLYDLRSIWAAFIGLPPVHGGSILTLLIFLLLLGFGAWRISTGRSVLGMRDLLLLLATSILPPVLLFATSFKPLGLTVFGERHLLPCIFSSLMLVAFGLDEICRTLPKPVLSWGAGALCLYALQWTATSKALTGPLREPYSEIAGNLRQAATTPVYTTWPYGIGETVNFYLGDNRVHPLPTSLSRQSTLPKQFLILYRPAVNQEKRDLESVMRQSAGASLDHCRYFSAVESSFGTRLCLVETAARN